MRIVFACFVWIIAIIPAWSFEIGEFTCQNPVDCAANSVVSVLPDWPEGFTRNETPEGSGVVLLDGTLIATADHVLGPAKSTRIKTRNGRILLAEIVMRHAPSDVALLKIADKLVPVTHSGEIEVADEVCAIGNSFGLGISISCGVISATQVSGTGFNRIEDFLQTDASVNPGMSGGALVTRDGRFVGLLSAIFTKQSDASIGVNFAVSAALINRLLEEYDEASKSVGLYRSGIAVRPNEPQAANGLIGAEVTYVKDRSMEAIAGIKVGDIILKVAGRRIQRAGAYDAAIALAASGRPLDAIIIRDGELITLTLKPE